MIKVSVCYSDKSGSEFASCSVSDLEFHVAILDDPAAFRDQVRVAYDRCVDAVECQLRGESAPIRRESAPSAPSPVEQSERFDGSAPQSARAFLGWYGQASDDVRQRVRKIAKGKKFSSMIREWTDAQALEVYQSVMGPTPTNGHSNASRR
jgi:hypothetical protein